MPYKNRLLSDNLYAVRAFLSTSCRGEAGVGGARVRTGGGRGGDPSGFHPAWNLIGLRPGLPRLPDFSGIG